MATAQILFHRFYYAKSFVKFNCYVSTVDHKVIYLLCISLVFCNGVYVSCC